MGIAASIGVAASGKPPAGDQANAVLTGSFVAVGPSAPFAFRGPMNLVIWASYSSSLTTTLGSLAATVASAGAIAAGNAINSANVPPGAVVGAIAGAAITLAIPPATLYGIVSPVDNAIKGLAVTAGLVGATVTGPGIPTGTIVTAIRTAAVNGAGGAVSISNTPTAATLNAQIPDPFVFTKTANGILTTGTDAAAIFTGADIVYVGNIQLERSFDGGSTWLPANLGSGGTLAQWSAGTPISIAFGEPEKQVLYRLNCLAYTSGVINYRISQTGGAAESLAIGQLN